MRKQKILVAIIALLILSGFSYLAVSSGVQAEKLQTKTIRLESTEAKLKDVNLQVKQLKDQSSTDKAKQQQLEKEKAELEKQLQAKAEAKAKLALAAENAAHALSAQKAAAATVPLPAGSHEDWMRQAGIAESDFGYVNYIVNRESGWNPNAVNKSSGACGLGQQLPCGKWAGAWNDPIAALVAMQGYAVGRYGSWAGAHSWWLSHSWW